MLISEEYLLVVRIGPRIESDVIFAKKWKNRVLANSVYGKIGSTMHGDSFKISI